MNADAGIVAAVFVALLAGAVAVAVTISEARTWYEDAEKVGGATQDPPN